MDNQLVTFDARVRIVTVAVLAVGLIGAWVALSVAGNATQFPTSLQVIAGALVGLVMGQSNPLSPNVKT